MDTLYFRRSPIYVSVIATSHPGLEAFRTFFVCANVHRILGRHFLYVGGFLMRRTRNRNKITTFAGLLVLLSLSFALNIWNNDFPLGYHGDEPKKARFILNGDQDFHHPLLILQLSRLANAVAGYQDDDVVIVGRYVSAAAGTFIVWFTFLIARRCFAGPWPYLAAFLTATSPLLVIHAHYLKEDVLFTACALAALLAILRFWENAITLVTTLALGSAIGLAMAAHYKSVLLWPLATVSAFILRVPQHEIWRRLPFLGVAFFVAEAVFLAVNYPILLNPGVFLEGLNHEYTHATGGHSLSIHAIDYWFLFHLRYSLVPGLTAPIAMLSLVGLIWVLARWKPNPTAAVVACYALVYYVVPEMVPSKPAPDFARYVLQVGPTAIILAVFAMERIHALLIPRVMRPLFWCLLAGISLWPAYLTTALNYHMASDTREKAQEWIASSGEKALYEHYAHENWDCVSLADLSLTEVKNSGVRYLVASDFRYERYFRGVQMDGQSEYVSLRYQAYEDLFRGVVKEIRPAFRSYAFSNPTIRIIDLEKLDQTDVMR